MDIHNMPYLRKVCQSLFIVAWSRRGIWFDQGKPKTPVRTAVMVVKMKKSCSDIACNSVQAQHLLGYIEPSGYRDSRGWSGQKVPCSPSRGLCARTFRNHSERLKGVRRGKKKERERERVSVNLLNLCWLYKCDWIYSAIGLQGSYFITHSLLYCIISERVGNMSNSFLNRFLSVAF